ncbi:MAG: uroporphyrinogen-III synthase [Hyphomicrobiales bacterium]|nr:MAG: uroporphyrinogen-III synthase [Hyphomicrobiales bacterium]
MASSKFVWVTRSSPYAFLTGHHLRSAGHKPLIAPVLAIRPVRYAPPEKPPDALIFTSTHGVQHHMFDVNLAEIPVYAVGRRTAMTARDAGYRNVNSADGNVSDLERLVAEKARPGCSIVHLGAVAPAGNLSACLNRRGFSARHVAVYESIDIPSEKLRPALAALPWIDGITVHSPKAGRRLAGFLADCGDLWRGTAFCISSAAAEPIRAITDGPILIAQRPNEQALTTLITADQEAALTLRDLP